MPPPLQLMPCWHGFPICACQDHYFVTITHNVMSDVNSKTRSIKQNKLLEFAEGTGFNSSQLHCFWRLCHHYLLYSLAPFCDQEPREVTKTAVPKIQSQLSLGCIHTSVAILDLYHYPTLPSSPPAPKQIMNIS